MPREAPLSGTTTSSAPESPPAKRPEPAPAERVPAGTHAPAFLQSAPRRYAGFPGIGATEVAPDVILFTPRRTPLSGTASVQGAAPQVWNTPSPERRAALPAPETPEEERLCLRSWALCAAAMAPVMFSTWMLMLPFLFRSNVTNIQMPPLPTPAASSRRPTVATATPHLPIPQPTPGRPAPTTPTIPATQPPKRTTASTRRCSDPPVIDDITGTFNASVYRMSAFLSGPSPSELMCLFNNTRVRDWTGTGKYYSVQSLPFQICSKLVYWSVAIENGKIKSRVPVFDQLYGLQQLRRTTDDLGFPDIKILVTLGGDASDTRQFTVAGREAFVLDTLTRDVLDTMSRMRLDGVALHWVQPRPDCRSGDDRLSFVRVVLGLNRAFARSPEHGQAIIAVITDNDRISIDYSRKVAHAVDYFFVFAYQVPSKLPDPYRLCELFTEQTNWTLREFARAGAGGPGVKTSSLCVVESLAPVTVAGVWDIDTGAVRMPEEGHRYGRGPLTEHCNDITFCKDNRSDSCILHRAGGTKYDVTFYAISSLAQYHDRFSLAALGLGAGHACVLITDFDYDSYDGSCAVPFVRYVLVRNLYYGARSGDPSTQYGLYRNPDCAPYPN
ncbi:hypothetical protein HPB50_014533 [Hyalomma asiaticum]|uniref:Uncharacterized protein n=1 Tax=Hyalomma asiaticum TaxID=266040 RepID=A0ACB7RUR8_HYAAI|nr:hypothetical protein HPB50_014533 [Hyalomma asiaticum]